MTHEKGVGETRTVDEASLNVSLTVEICRAQRTRPCLRGSKSADPPEFLALDAFRLGGIALDLFLAASSTGYCQALAWLASLGHTPLSVDRLAINLFLAK